MTVEERVAALKGQSVLKTLSQPTSVAGRVAALKQQEQSAPVTPVTVTPTASPVAAKAETPKFTLPEPTYKAARSSMGDSAAAVGVTTPTAGFSALTRVPLPSVKMDQAVEQKQLRDSAKEIARLLSYDVDAAEKEIEALRMNMTSAKMQNMGTAGGGTHGTFQAGTQRIDTTDTQNRIDELQRDVAKAKTAQAQARYSALPNASDFSSYAGKGAAIKNPSVQEAERGVSIAGWKPFAKKVNNVVTYSRDNYGKLMDTDDVIYHYMTDDEVKLYSYLLAKEGQKSAQEYLDYLEENLNSRLGKVQAKGVRSIENPVGRTLATGFYGATAGLDQWAGGLRQLASEERQPTSPTQFGSAYIREDLKDTGPKILGNSLGQIGYDLVNTGANMTPAILIAAATGGTGLPAAISGGIGAAAVALPAAGNAYNQALGEGYGSDEAKNYAMLVGASEGALQYLLGGIGALGGKMTGNVAKSTLRNIDNALLRVAGTLGIKMVGEGMEEYLQESLEPVFRNLAFDENNEFKLVTEDALYSALLGALTAGLTEAGGVIQTETAPGRANAGIDGAYDAMKRYGPFSSEATNAAQKANRTLGLPTWAGTSGTCATTLPTVADVGVSMVPGALADNKAASTREAVQVNPGVRTKMGDVVGDIPPSEYAAPYRALPDEGVRGADGTLIAEKKVPSTNGVKGRDAQKAELLPIRKVELLPVWETQGGTTADPSGEIGAPSFVPLPIFDRRLGARSTPALPAWGAQGGTTADLSGEIGASNFVPLPIFDGRLGARSTPALPAWGAQGGTTADPSGEIGASNFVPLPIFDGRLGARSTPALPAWGAQDGKTVDNPGENGIIVGKDTEGAGKTFSSINPGSLDESIANTFRSGTYTKKVLTEDTTFYRVYGGGAGEVGLYMSRTPQLGGMQSQLDLALNPKWGNSATHVTKVTVPKGTVIYEGFAAPQTINGGAGFLMGGGNQIYIPEVNASWFGK